MCCRPACRVCVLHGKHLHGIALMYFHFLCRVGYVPSVVLGRLSKPTMTTETVHITMVLISRNRAVVTGYDDISRKFYNLTKTWDNF